MMEQSQSRARPQPKRGFRRRVLPFSSTQLPLLPSLLPTSLTRTQRQVQRKLRRQMSLAPEESMVIIYLPALTRQARQDCMDEDDFCTLKIREYEYDDLMDYFEKLSTQDWADYTVAITLLDVILCLPTSSQRYSPIVTVPGSIHVPPIPIWSLTLARKRVSLQASLIGDLPSRHHH